MLISEAYAEAPATPVAADSKAASFAGLLPLVLIFIVFYFLALRPQQKRYREHQEIVKKVQRGDRVMTGGGIFGTVTKVDSDEMLQVEIAEGTVVQVARATIANVVSKAASEAEKPAESTPKGKKKSLLNKKQIANDN